MALACDEPTNPRDPKSRDIARIETSGRLQDRIPSLQHGRQWFEMPSFGPLAREILQCRSGYHERMYRTGWGFSLRTPGYIPEVTYRSFSFGRNWWPNNERNIIRDKGRAERVIALPIDGP